MAGAGIGEPGALGAREDDPAHRRIRLVVDGDRRDGTEIADHPRQFAGRRDPDAVRGLPVDLRRVGERRLAVDLGGAELAPGLAGFGRDEDVPVLRRENLRTGRYGAGCGQRADRYRADRLSGGCRGARCRRFAGVQPRLWVSGGGAVAAGEQHGRQRSGGGPGEPCVVHRLSGYGTSDRADPDRCTGAPNCLTSIFPVEQR